MMDFSNTLVLSLAGKDKGRIFVVLKTVDENHILYADGRRRRVEKPKLKKIKHIRILGSAGIADVSKATNGMLRKATAAYLDTIQKSNQCTEQPADKEG
ncbi:MAG: RNA-binding protein [Clostridiales bacterium]|jgi:ribosomal protein L14E/L6E/L27E|nr:RNA-binding protein [Clostridiales bacterium]